MGTYTTFTKDIICPYWKVKISLIGKYPQYDSDGKFHFSYSTCSIIENSKLPYSKQDKYLSFYIPCDLCPCNLLDTFTEIYEENFSRLK